MEDNGSGRLEIGYKAEQFSHHEDQNIQQFWFLVITQEQNIRADLYTCA